MLDQNKTGKYLKYAIGEIILVIIGILIALQINNWNENQKIESELQSSLVNMIDELQENMNFFSEEGESFQERLEKIQKLMNNEATDDDLKVLINYIAQDVNAKPFKRVFELIKDNKQLHLIEDEELIKQINQFYEHTLPDVYKIAAWHDGFVSNNIDPYVLENIPLENGLVDPKISRKLLKEIKFKNILTYQSIIYEGYVKSCTFIVEQAQELRNMITSYLKQHD